MATNTINDFFEDNFLCDDDWGYLAMEADTDSSGSSNVEWALDYPVQTPTSYVQHENETGFEQADLFKLISGIDSPPLTPPEENLELNLETHITGEECGILNSHCGSLLTEAEVQNNKLPTSLRPNTSDDPSQASARGRSSSNSSSTSAYSSQSSSPPLRNNSSSNALENIFFNSSTNMKHDAKYSQDEGFHEQGLLSKNRKIHSLTRKQNQWPKIQVPTWKRDYPQSTTTLEHSEHNEAEFDRKVQEALKETNRLLNMHKMKPCMLPDKNKLKAKPPSASQAASGVDLRELCDSTILRNLPRPQTNSERKTEKTVKELKRKASEKLKSQSKKSLLSNSSLPVHDVAATSRSAQLTTSQCCVISSSNSQQVTSAPATCGTATSQAPVKIIVKQEPVPKLYLSTSTCNNHNNAAITLIQTNNQNVIVASKSQVVPQPSVSVCQKDAIPLSSLLIKPERGSTSIPISSLTIKNCPPDAKVSANPIIKTTQINQTFVYKSGADLSTEVKQSYRKPTAKPLMLSQPATTPIIPNGNITYPSTVLQNSLNLANSLETTDEVQTGNISSLKERDIEMQSRILKRQQRMIKNRDAACRSRQRRKEHMSMLEQQMNECLEDNKQLRALNCQLKSRISELEQENATLRSLATSSNISQRKAACLLMLVLFIGLNINPMSYLASRNVPTDLAAAGLSATGNDSNSLFSSWPAPVETGFHGRQLLAVEEKENENEQTGKLKGKTREVALTKVNKKQAYWADDMVKDYKKEHFTKILELMQDSSLPVPLQRLLRRKFKEELGIRFPLPLPRTRRISYTPTRSSNEYRAADKRFVDQFLNADATVNPREKVAVPPSPPHVKPVISPCDHPAKRMEQPNQTESVTINDNLAKWIERHEGQQRKHKKVAADKAATQHRRRHVATSPSRNGDKRSIPALYENRDRKLKKLLEAIDRQNDTVYMISFSKDHILLPATMANSSRHSKLSLVLPTAPPNDSFASVGQQTMIQIECEVRSTSYIRIDRELLPGEEFFVNEKTASNPTSRQANHENPKRRAYHGSKSKSANRGKETDGADNSAEDDVIVSDVVDL